MNCDVPQDKTGPRGQGPAGGVAPRLAVRCRQVMSVLCLLALVLTAAGCSRADNRAPGLGARLARDLDGLFTATPAPGPLPWLPAARGPQPPCPVRQIAGFSCLMAERIGVAERYAASRAGTIGIVLHDRLTGATWRNRFARTEFPAASTIKLAMITDILLRADAGQITLGPGDWSLIYNALHESSDTAATALWDSFENGSFLGRIQAFGMRHAYFTSSPPIWGFMYCTPVDLDNLMNYVLAKIPAASRDYIVSHLRHVATIQQWGVWGAGRANRAGNKDGWEDDGGTWITNTVGFAGPGEQYTLAIMDNLGGGTFHEGSNTLTQISALLFQGHHAPQPVAQATP
jgi:hypothetical protein